MSARGTEIRLLARPAGTLLPGAVLVLSVGVTGMLLLRDARLAALIALSLLLLIPVLHCFNRPSPMRQVERLLLKPGGACEAAVGAARRQVMLVSVFSAGSLTALQMDCGKGRRRVALWTASWPRAQRSALGRWLTSVS